MSKKYILLGIICALTFTSILIASKTQKEPAKENQAPVETAPVIEMNPIISDTPKEAVLITRIYNYENVCPFDWASSSVKTRQLLLDNATRLRVIDGGYGLPGSAVLVEKDGVIMNVACADSRIVLPKQTFTGIKDGFFVLSNNGENVKTYEFNLFATKEIVDIQKPNSLHFLFPVDEPNNSHGWYLSDTENIYYAQYSNNIVTIDVTKVYGADPETFRISTSSEKIIATATDSKSLFLREKNLNINPHGLENIRANIYKNEEGFFEYSLGNVKKIVNPEDVYTRDLVMDCAAINEPCKDRTDSNPEYGYFLRDGVIWYLDNPAPQARPSTTRIIINGGDGSGKYGATYRFAKDDQHAFFEGSIIEGADSNSFQPLFFGNTDYWYRYTRDKNHVFFGTTTIPFADPLTFHTLTPSEGYALDSNRVFFNTYAMPNADNKSFKIIIPEGGFAWQMTLYAQDRDSLYYEGKPILGADSNSFKVITSVFAKDKRGFYRQGVFDPTIPNTFIPPYEGEG
jgi:hypothetical protein